MMQTSPARTTVLVALVSVSCGALGCGSTRTSNTVRTATEQLLISDAIDRTVSEIDFSPLAGETVFFDESRLGDVVDKGYLVSSLRQHLLASGCILKETRDAATFVVEPRVGAVGTDNDDLLFGVPALQMPQMATAPALPAAIPEIPFAKRREQRAVAKVSVFAYRRDTGEPVWQSGLALNESTANDIWVFGAGPFRRGAIYGDKPTVEEELVSPRGDFPDAGPHVARLDDEARFAGLRREAGVARRRDEGVVQASATAPIEPATTPSSGPVEPPRVEEGPPMLPPPRPIEEAPQQ